MPNYEQGTLGKLVVQDWDVIQTYPDVPLLYILTRQQAAALVPLCPPLKWSTRWENPPDKDTRAAFVAEMMFNLMNPITCGMLQECIGELLEAQTQIILQGMQNFEQFGTSTPGQPMTTEERTENLAGSSNPGCDLDILWAQCLALVQFTNRAATDVLEKIEAATNVVELAGLSGEIPVIGWILHVFGEELATDTINYYQEAVQEAYAAEYTEDVEIELACQLFCLFRFDCTPTIDGVYNQFYSNVSDEVPDNPLEAIELLALLAGIDVTADTVVDLVFWALWGMAKLASMMFSSVDVATLKTLLLLAVDDASPDWMLLCECAEDWTYTATLTELEFWTDYVLPDAGLWDAAGWEANPASTFNGTAIFGIATSAPFFCIDVQVKITAAMTGDQNGLVVGSLALDVAVQDGMGSATEYTIVVMDDLDGIAVGYTPNDLGAGSPDFPGATYEVTVRGTGYQPPELGG